ncbi:leucine-rich repeat domain-containing protein [Pseudoalteromonas denitrificans]|uniref:Leucine Rich repeat-containing protein n=1 Tax=Pseudoalteromonas denitrificans DSM 6059 TaxID=1123010 RepID=A0A1I1M425_9GAMM|nr:leucine-rich repeat domain-containing protein [Pseudoalteromonas denitrificans]SFC80179.1 Leucine Rich repeat-containing protein [Pseudoalteromonas denitrificans DSM 6059]
MKHYYFLLIVMILTGCNKKSQPQASNTEKVDTNDFSLSMCISSAKRKVNGDASKVIRLVCQTGGVKTLKGISELVNLEQLYLQNNKINTLIDLGKMPSLKIISLAGNHELTSLAGLEGAINLEELQATKSKNLKNISAIKGLTKLKTIAIMMADISDISALKNLNELEEVNFNYNKVQNISSLSNKPKLTSLHLYNNQIDSLEPLVNNKKMKLVGIGTKNMAHCEVLIELDKTLANDARIFGPKECGVNPE